MKHLATIAFLAQILFLLASNPAAAQPARRPATAPATDSLVTPMRIQTLRGFTYIYSSSQTSFETLGATIDPAINKLLAGLKASHIQPAGPLVFIYHNAMPGTRFTLDIGMPVEEGPESAEAPAGLKKTKFEPFKCATVLYSGPTSRFPEVYRNLFGQIFQSGLAPTGISRESYLYWESRESANNVIQIQIGIE